MGWNNVSPAAGSKLFEGMVDPQFYFLHSYFLEPEIDSCAIGQTVYGRRFVSAIQKLNIFATQFHPEKSHCWGMRLLKNFSVL
jgi:glutamine amidotransferase